MSLGGGWYDRQHSYQFRHKWVLVVFVRSPSGCVVPVALSILFRGTVKLYTVGQLIFADGVFDYVLRDTDSFGSPSHDLVPCRSTGADFHVILGGERFGGGFSQWGKFDMVLEHIMVGTPLILLLYYLYRLCVCRKLASAICFRLTARRIRPIRWVTTISTSPFSSGNRARC